MRPTSKLFIAGVAILAVALGCSSPPEQEEIDAVQRSIDQARVAEAEIWAPGELQAAEEALSAAQSAIAAEEGKWFKSYDRANEFLARARDEARNAAEAAVANKAQTRKDAEGAIAAAENTLQSAQARLRSGSRADASVYRSDLAPLPKELEQARASLDAGDFKGALETATAVQDRAASVITEIDEARTRRPLPPK